MPIQNSDVAETFEKVADLLEIEGENQFRTRAYRDAARTVGGHSRSVAEMVEDEDLTGLPGIGEDLAGKVREIVETGTLSQAEELEKRTDPGLRELLRWPRGDAEGLVEALGGRTSSNVSGNTDYVVAGPDAGSKLEEAEERDVPVMDEEEFASFLQDRGVDPSRER